MYTKYAHNIAYCHCQYVNIVVYFKTCPSVCPFVCLYVRSITPKHQILHGDSLFPGGVTWALFSPPSIGKGASRLRRREASRCRRRGVCGPAVPPFGFRAVPYLESESKLAPNLLVLGLNNCCFHTRSARFKKHQNQQRPGLHPNPTGGAYSAPPDSLAGGEGW